MKNKLALSLAVASAVFATAPARAAGDAAGTVSTAISIPAAEELPPITVEEETPAEQALREYKICADEAMAKRNYHRPRARGSASRFPEEKTEIIELASIPGLAERMAALDFLGRIQNMGTSAERVEHTPQGTFFTNISLTKSVNGVAIYSSTSFEFKEGAKGVTHPPTLAEAKAAIRKARQTCFHIKRVLAHQACVADHLYENPSSNFGINFWTQALDNIYEFYIMPSKGGAYYNLDYPQENKANNPIIITQEIISAHKPWLRSMGPPSQVLADKLIPKHAGEALDALAACAAPAEEFYGATLQDLSEARKVLERAHGDVGTALQDIRKNLERLTTEPAGVPQDPK